MASPPTAWIIRKFKQGRMILLSKEMDGQAEVNELIRCSVVVGETRISQASHESQDLESGTGRGNLLKIDFYFLLRKSFAVQYWLCSLWWDHRHGPLCPASEYRTFRQATREEERMVPGMLRCHQTFQMRCDKLLTELHFLAATGSPSCVLPVYYETYPFLVMPRTAQYLLLWAPGRLTIQNQNIRMRGDLQQRFYHCPLGTYDAF